MRDQALLFGPGEAGNHALPRGRPGKGQGAPDFLGDVARLIIGQMILPPDFECLRDGGVSNVDIDGNNIL